MLCRLTWEDPRARAGTSSECTQRAVTPQVDNHNVMYICIIFGSSGAGAVTGSATYASFLSSLVRVGGKGPGVHIC